MLYLDRFSKATNKKSTETPKPESRPVPTFEASIPDFHKSQSLGSSEILNVHHRSTPVSLVESNTMQLVNLTCLFCWTLRVAHANPCCRAHKNKTCQKYKALLTQVFSVWQFKTCLSTLWARRFWARGFRALLLCGLLSPTLSYCSFLVCAAHR